MIGDSVFNNFYQGKRFLVTGVAGVKGTWLVLALLDAGADVIGLDIREPEVNSNFRASGLSDSIRFVRGDVADVELVRKLMAEVDGVFHLAAVALVRDAHRRPFETYRSNTLGTAAVLEALRLSNAPRRAVFVTTDKVYRPSHGRPWVETDPLGASGPYAVSKSCAEFVIEDYERSYFRETDIKIGIARAGNVIIGGDLYSSRSTCGAGRIVVDCYEALAEHRPPEIYCPRFTRSYTYGLDVICGYMTLMSRVHEPAIRGQAFNFGPREALGISNAALATRICELWGTGMMWYTGAVRNEPFEHQALSCEKSENVLAWKPAFALEDTLRDATRWYKEWALRKRALRDGDLYDLNRELLLRHRAAAAAQGLAWAAPVAVSHRAAGKVD